MSRNCWLRCPSSNSVQGGGIVGKGGATIENNYWSFNSSPTPSTPPTHSPIHHPLLLTLASARASTQSPHLISGPHLFFYVLHPSSTCSPAAGQRPSPHLLPPLLSPLLSLCNQPSGFFNVVIIQLVSHHVHGHFFFSSLLSLPSTFLYSFCSSSSSPHLQVITPPPPSRWPPASPSLHWLPLWIMEERHDISHFRCSLLFDLPSFVCPSRVAAVTALHTVTYLRPNTVLGLLLSKSHSSKFFFPLSLSFFKQAFCMHVKLGGK